MKDNLLMKYRGMEKQKPIGQIIKKDLEFYNPSSDIIQCRTLWTLMIYVLSLTQWKVKDWLSICQRTEEAVKKSQPSFTSFYLNLYDLWIDSVFFALS